MSADHKVTYELHERIVRAERNLKDSGWISGELISYDNENPLNSDWGVRYTKGDKSLFLNRFTVNVINTLIE